MVSDELIIVVLLAVTFTLASILSQYYPGISSSSQINIGGIISSSTATSSPVFPQVVTQPDVFSNYLADPNKANEPFANWKFGVFTYPASSASSIHSLGGITIYPIEDDPRACDIQHDINDVFIPYGSQFDIVYFDEPFSGSSSLCGSSQATANIFNQVRDAARSANPNVLVGYAEGSSAQFLDGLNSGAHPDFLLGEDYYSTSTYSWLQQQRASGTVKYIGMWTISPGSFDLSVINDRGAVFVCGCGTWHELSWPQIYAGFHSAYQNCNSYSISSISLPASVNAGSQFTLGCTSSQTDIACVYPTGVGSSCVWQSWNGNTAKFLCTAGSTSGTYTFGCFVGAGSISNCCSGNTITQSYTILPTSTTTTTSSTTTTSTTSAQTSSTTATSTTTASTTATTIPMTSSTTTQQTSSTTTTPQATSSTTTAATTSSTTSSSSTTTSTTTTYSTTSSLISTTISTPAQPCRTYDIPCWIGYFILRIFGLAK